MEKVYTHNYFLTAAECDAQRGMSLPLLVERVIETATEHANSLHIGFDDLERHHIGWVLSRLSVEIDRWPAVNTSYGLTTWIVDLRRLYSTRAHEITDGEGNVIGRVRTIWAAIDTELRTAADLSVLDSEAFVCPGRECELPQVRRLAALGDDAESFKYCFRYSDIDINRHVTSRRYVELALNCCPMEWYDANRIIRFDINFHHEALCGQGVEMRSRLDEDGERSSLVCELVADNVRIMAAGLDFVRR